MVHSHHGRLRRCRQGAQSTLVSPVESAWQAIARTARAITSSTQSIAATRCCAAIVELFRSPIGDRFVASPCSPGTPLLGSFQRSWGLEGCAGTNALTGGLSSGRLAFINRMEAKMSSAKADFLARGRPVCSEPTREGSMCCRYNQLRRSAGSERSARLVPLLFLLLTLACGDKKPPPLPPVEVLVVPVVQKDVPVIGEWIGTL